MIEKLKIYLSSGSVPMVPQMIDFASCAQEQSVIKLIGWYRNPLTEKQLFGTQAIYSRQISAVTPGFIKLVLKVIEKFKPLHVEIHGNVVFTRNELYPLVNALSRVIMRGHIKIHLYDDGMRAIGERNELHQLSHDEFTMMANKFTGYLGEVIVKEQNPFAQRNGNEWLPLMGYVWHKLFDVTYHLMNIHEETIYPQSPFGCFLSPHVKTMRHDDLKLLTNKQMAFCMSLMNVDFPVFSEISQLVKNERSVLYMGTGYYDKKQDDVITDKQVSKIIKMKETGVIRGDDFLILKPHPINSPENSEKIRQALGVNTCVIPNAIPFEMLTLNGVVPSAIICPFSTLLFTMPNDRFRHIIGNDENTELSLQNPIVQQLISNKVISEHQISGWHD